MVRLRKARDRGVFRNHWLDARFTFSFGPYHDERFMGYSDLLVLNDDRVQPGQGFGPHGHVDIEALSYPLTGAIEHRDSLGNIERIGVGDVQHMTAGRGIRHSEMNASAHEPEHHLQFWIAPAETGLPPAHAVRHFSRSAKLNRLCLIASADGREGSHAVPQDIRIFASVLAHAALDHEPPAGRAGYVHVARGELHLNGHGLAEGDGAFIEAESRIQFSAPDEAEFLFFDLRPIGVHPTA
ncbi:MAG: pirin family protein [Burkholderiales bacterium]|nr:pirin family protein [Burkholderiales bacterium]